MPPPIWRTPKVSSITRNGWLRSVARSPLANARVDRRSTGCSPPAAGRSRTSAPVISATIAMQTPTVPPIAPAPPPPPPPRSPPPRRGPLPHERSGDQRDDRHEDADGDAHGDVAARPIAGV